MKKYIAPQITVEVVVDRYHEDNIAASSIKPIKPNYPVDDTVDEQALADYDSFIQDSIAELEDLDLEISEYNISSRSDSSRYFTIVDLTQEIEHTMKYMIFLRISDHFPIDRTSEEQKRIDEGIRKYRNKTRAKFIEQQGHKVTWKVRQVIVNGQEFDSYDSALTRIKELAEQWAEMLKGNICN